MAGHHRREWQDTAGYLFDVVDAGDNDISVVGRSVTRVSLEIYQWPARGITDHRSPINVKWLPGRGTIDAEEMAASARIATRYAFFTD